MAKKKVKKKASVSSSYNNLVKHFNKMFILGWMETTYKNVDYRESLKILEELKDKAYLYEKTKGVIKLDNIILVEFINYIEEMIFLCNREDRNVSEILLVYKERITNMMKEHGISLELFIVISDYFDVVKINNASKQGYSCSRIMSFMELIAFYCALFRITLKNKLIESICVLDNELFIKYGSKPVVSNDELRALETKAVSDKDYKRRNTVRMKIAMYYQERLPESDGEISLIDSSDLTDIYFRNVNLNIPFEDKKEFILNKLNGNFLLERRYGVQTSGVLLDVISKNKDIDSILVREDKINFYLDIKIKSTANVFTRLARDEYDYEIEAKSTEFYNPLSDGYSVPKKNHVNIRAVLNKEALNSNDKNDCLKIPRVMIYGVNSENILLQLIYLAITSVYVAVCDNDICKSEVRLHSVINNKGFYTKAKYYRVGYIRRLPVGQKMSDIAKENAKKEGFVYIPEGYTFVSAANIALSKEKVIKIR